MLLPLLPWFLSSDAFMGPWEVTLSPKNLAHQPSPWSLEAHLRSLYQKPTISQCLLYVPDLHSVQSHLDRSIEIRTFVFFPLVSSIKRDARFANHAIRASRQCRERESVCSDNYSVHTRSEARFLSGKHSSRRSTLPYRLELEIGIFDLDKELQKYNDGVIWMI